MVNLLEMKIKAVLYRGGPPRLVLAIKKEVAQVSLSSSSLIGDRTRMLPYQTYTQKSINYQVIGKIFVLSERVSEKQNVDLIHWFFQC